MRFSLIVKLRAGWLVGEERRFKSEFKEETVYGLNGIDQEQIGSGIKENCY